MTDQALFPSVVEAFPRVTRPLEGCVLWPYLDVFGLATVGFGCLVDSWQEFRKPDWHGTSGAPASASFVDGCRATLKMQPKARHFNQYKSATPLRIDDAEAAHLMLTRAEEFAEYMRDHHFPDWDVWPADAQLAWMLIAWACGPGAPDIFKTAAAASKQGDWALARRYGVINPGKPGQANWNPGIVPRNAQIDLCFANAEAIATPGYATPALYWPGHVLDAPELTLPAAAKASALLAGYDVHAEDCGLTGSCHLPLAA